MEVLRYSERRSSIRKPVSLEVAVYYNGLGILRCLTRNLSLHGMLLDTGAMVIPQNAAVDLTLIHRIAGITRLQRIPATVIRVEDSGAGLIFHDLSLEAYGTVYSMLFPQKESYV